ncbi:hypothetical protein O988_08053 [Pseudogymnoascus sp. VKM F-3808]|nr:hypothetical protein O988_08053 [Pseudogymnoascus sp. VKM F-3808]
MLPTWNFNAVPTFHGRGGCRHKPLGSTLLEEKESPAALSNAYHWTISAIPGSPEFVSIRKLQLWVMLKSDAVLQAESWNRTDSGRTGTTWTGLLNAANVDYNRTTRLSKAFQRYVPTDRPTGRPTTASLPHRQRGVSAKVESRSDRARVLCYNRWFRSRTGNRASQQLDQISRDNNGFVSRVLFSFSRCNAGLLPHYRSIRSVSLMDRPNLAFDGVGYGHGGRWVWWAWWVRWTWWTCPSSQPYLHGLHLKSSTTDGWEGGRRAGGPIARTLYRRRKRSIVPPTIPHQHTDDAAKGPSRLLSNITLRWGSDQTLEGWRMDFKRAAEGGKEAASIYGMCMVHAL